MRTFFFYMILVEILHILEYVILKKYIYTQREQLEI